MNKPLDVILQQVDQEGLLEETLVRLNARVLGLTIAGLCGSGLFLVTLVLLLKGGANVGAHLNLLGHIFPFYKVSWVGLPLAVLYGGMAGFLAGYALSRLYTLVAVRRAPEWGYSETGSRDLGKV